jgi:hypothetical protein
VAVEFRRVDDELWPATRRAIAEHWQADHPLLDKRLFDWQYRGYGPAADGQPWAFGALDGGEVVAFIGLIPGVVRHVKADGVELRPQALVALWFVAESHRAGALGVLLLRHAQKQLEVVGSLGVVERAVGVYQRLGLKEVAVLDRWVVPLSEAYGDLLAAPAEPQAVSAWLERVPSGAPAAAVALDPEALASLAAAGLCGLERTAEFYAWRYGESVGLTYQTLELPDAGRAIVRVEQPAHDGAAPVLRVIELLPSADTRAADLAGGVLVWGRARGCCAADFQVSPGDPLGPGLRDAGFALRDPGRPETLLAEVFRPYRPAADPINVVWRPDPDDVAPWRFLKSDGDMDRTTAPVA